jgi:hypothetical protein
VGAVSWLCPKFGTMVLNVDGSVFLESNLGGFGSIIYDHTRSLIKGFLDNINSLCIFHDEILELHHGLNMCSDEKVYVGHNPNTSHLGTHSHETKKIK